MGSEMCIRDRPGARRAMGTVGATLPQHGEPLAREPGRAPRRGAQGARSGVRSRGRRAMGAALAHVLDVVRRIVRLSQRGRVEGGALSVREAVGGGRGEIAREVLALGVRRGDSAACRRGSRFFRLAEAIDCRFVVSVRLSTKRFARLPAAESLSSTGRSHASLVISAQAGIQPLIVAL